MFTGLKINLLARKLSGYQADKRRRAIMSLALIDDPRAVVPIIKALKDVNENVRKAAVVILGEIGNPVAVTPLIKLFHEEWNKKVLEASVKALIKFRDERALEPLTGILNDKSSDSSLRKLIVLELGQLKSKRAVELILPALNDSYDGVRKVAVDALGVIKDPCSINPIIKLLEEESSRRVVTASIVTLGKFIDDRIIEPLVNVFFTKAPDSRQRVLIITELSKTSTQHTFDAIYRCLADPNPDVRKTAAEKLADMGEIKWNEIMQGDSGDFNRIAASGDPYALDILHQALWSKDSKDRKAVIEALRIFKDVRSIKPLIRLLDFEYSEMKLYYNKAKFTPSDEFIMPWSWDVYEEALKAISEINTAQASDYIAEELEKCSRYVRKNLAIILGKMKDKRAVVPLTELLGDDDPKKRRTAAVLLGELGDDRWKEIVLGDRIDYKRISDLKDCSMGCIMSGCMNNLDSEDENERNSVARKLINNWGMAGISSLVDALQSGNDNMFQAAAWALDEEVEGNAAANRSETCTLLRKAMPALIMEIENSKLQPGCSYLDLKTNRTLTLLELYGDETALPVLEKLLDKVMSRRRKEGFKREYLQTKQYCGWINNDHNESNIISAMDAIMERK